VSAYFIAGAGTDIGKTYAAGVMIRTLRAKGLRVSAYKPVASGCPSFGEAAFAATDTAQLLTAQGLKTTPEAVQACSPWRFRAPLSPDMAAAAEGRSLRLEPVVRWCLERMGQAAPQETVLIEGVGGVMSPAAEDGLNLDWIKRLGAPAILVGGTYLGAISHALTALETLRIHGVVVAALVVNETAGSEVDYQATLQTLRRFAGETPLVPLRRGGATLALPAP